MTHGLLHKFICLDFYLALDVQAFERLLGPCVEVMKRNMAAYDADMERAFGGKDKIGQLR